MKSAELMDMMIQGIEAATNGEATFGRLNPGAVGFRCHLSDGSLFHVRVEQPQGFNWDAPVIEADLAHRS